MTSNRNRLLPILVLFVVSLLLLTGGVAAGAGAFAQRRSAIRGWTDPAQTADLPKRLPLAGVNVELTQYDAPTLDRELTRIAAAGFVWVRQTFRWPDIEPQQGEFTFSKYDPIVAAVKAHPSLKLVAVLDETPAWARRPDASDRLISPPASMAAFGTFAGKFAAHYADQIDEYQVWDEPNLNTAWGGLDPQPADYAAMLKAAYTAIHGDDPTAAVIAAALAPTVETGPHNLSDVLYLRALYEVGAGDAFDAAAGKPYGYDTGPEDRIVSQDVLNFSHLILLRDVMVQHGDGRKPLWGSNFGWNHLPDGWEGLPSIWGKVDASSQREYTRAAYQRAAQEWPWIGGLILEHWQPPVPADDPMQGFAVSAMADDWFESGKFFNPANQALTVGVYDPADPRLTYSGDWRFGELGADVRHLTTGDPPGDGSANQIHFSFEGSSLAFQVRRADYVAYLYVSVDGQPANALPRNNGDAYILLKSPDLQPHTDLIVAANNLKPGLHTAEVRAYLGYDQWELAGIAVGAAPDTRRFDLLIAGAAVAGLLSLMGLAVTGRLLVRRAGPGARTALLSQVLAYLRQMAAVLAGIGVSWLALLGIFLTWGGVLPNLFRRDPPTLAITVVTIGLIYLSPSLIVTVVAVAALWLIIYNRPIAGLALVVFWTPFFLMPVELYIRALPMVEVSLALTTTAMIVRGLVHWKARPRPLLRFRAADWVMLAFVALAMVTVVWSDQRGPALRELLTMVIEPVIFYTLLRTVRLTNRDVVRLVDVVILAGVAVAGIGLYYYFLPAGGPGVVIAEQGSRRLASVYGSPNNAALFLGRCLPFAFAMLLVAPGLARRLIAGIALLIIGIAIVLTQSGGAVLLGIPAAVICVLVLWDRRRGLAAAGVVVAGLIALIPLSRFIPRLQGVLDLSRSSSLIRTQVWSSAISLIRDRPLTGAGLDQFLYLYRSRYILPDAWREPNLSHPHNFVLDYWISLGILGPVILVALQVAFWRSALAAWRRWREIDKLLAAVAIGAMGSMADFLAHGLVDNSYFVVDLAFIFCLTLALVLRLENPLEQGVSNGTDSKHGD